MGWDEPLLHVHLLRGNHSLQLSTLARLPFPLACRLLFPNKTTSSLVLKNQTIGSCEICILPDNSQRDLRAAPQPWNTPVPTLLEFNPSPFSLGSRGDRGSVSQQLLQISTRGRRHQRLGQEGGQGVPTAGALGPREEVLLSFLGSKS